MRLLKFNNQIVDIDKQTAIGIDYQGYDVKNPGKRKVSISNNFTIPATSYNLKLIGFLGNPHSISTDVYDYIYVDYWNDNKQFIKNGNLRVTETSERISCFIYEKEDFWAEMDKLLWPDFLEEFITWMQAEKGLPSLSSPYTGTWQQFVDVYRQTTEGVFLPFFISNLALYSPDEVTYLENTSNIWVKYNTDIAEDMHLGGHFCIYCKTIFEFIEYKYDVDLSVLSEDYDYNIFEDAVASVMYVAARNITVKYATPSGFYFDVDLTGKFSPEDNAEDKASKSLGNFTKAFFNWFNCLVDKIPTTDLSDKYIIRRFDDLTEAPIIDFSGKLFGKYRVKPLIDGYKQVNYISFSSVYEAGDKLTNAKQIVCLNKNIDAGGGDNSLFQIDSYIPGGVAISGDTLLNLSVSESFKTFVFMISQGVASTNIKISENDVEYSATASLAVAKIYSLTSEYNTLASMIQYPKFYQVKKYLTLLDIDSIVYFAKYYIKELGGYFFLNKISGYNPQKSNDPTTVELIKLP